MTYERLRAMSTNGFQERPEASRTARSSAPDASTTGSTQAIAYPTPTARRGETFMLFAYPTGVQGNVVNEGTNELVIPNYKQSWADIRRLSAKPRSVEHLSFKSKEYRAS